MNYNFFPKKPSYLFIKLIACNGPYFVCISVQEATAMTDKESKLLRHNLLYI